MHIQCKLFIKYYFLKFNRNGIGSANDALTKSNVYFGTLLKNYKAKSSRNNEEITYFKNALQESLTKNKTLKQKLIETEGHLTVQKKKVNILQPLNFELQNTVINGVDEFRGKIVC